MNKRKHNSKGRGGNVLADFVALERYLLRSNAWRSSSCLARAAYIEIGFRYTGANNGTIQVSCQMLADVLGVSKDSAARAVKELTERGFVDCVRKGYFTVKAKVASQYRMTAFRCDVTGQLPTKDFMRWQTSEEKNTVRFKPHLGPTDRTDKELNPKKTPSRYDGSDPQRQNRPSHGTMHRTYLYSNHLPPAQALRSEAQQVGGQVRLNDSASPEFLDHQFRPIKALAHLDRSLPAHLKSWARIPTTYQFVAA